MSFLETFDTEFFTKCNPKTKKFLKYKISNNLFQRGEGFRLLFNLLELSKKNTYQFVETGVLRKKDNWIDGQSTFLLQEFLKFYTGNIRCVDISLDACNDARSILNKTFVTVECNDSLEFLKTIDVKNVDFFHLDSYDVKWHNDEPSADHHLKEFLIIEPNLQPGTIVMIDDNVFLTANNKRSGKGRKIYEYLLSKEKLPLYDNYQLIYQF
jgi:hypothetical protein